MYVPISINTRLDERKIHVSFDKHSLIIGIRAKDPVYHRILKRKGIEKRISKNFWNRRSEGD